MVQAASLAADLLQLVVETDRIALQCRHVGVGVKRVEAARGMPGRAGGQLRALDEQHVTPAQLGQVVEHAAPDHAAADHRHPHMRLHRSPSRDCEKAILAGCADCGRLAGDTWSARGDGPGL
jgi:hypothetical protein